MRFIIEISADTQPGIMRQLDACEEQIKRLTESATKAESEKATEEKSVHGFSGPTKIADKILASGDLGKFEALPDGGYLSPGPSIEPLPDSHKSAAAVIEENIPAPQRIEQGVKTLKIPPAPDFDEEFPF